MADWQQSSSQLTHRDRDKMEAISQTTFSSAFPWTKMFEFWLKFHGLAPTKPLSEPVMVSLLTHICVTRSQWVKARMSNYTQQQRNYYVKMTPAIRAWWAIHYHTRHLIVRSRKISMAWDQCSEFSRRLETDLAGVSVAMLPRRPPNFTIIRAF